MFEASLAQLIRGANKDHEDERNLPRDLARGRHNPILISKFNEIFFYKKIFEEKIYYLVDGVESILLFQQD